MQDRVQKVMGVVKPVSRIRLLISLCLLAVMGCATAEEVSQVTRFQSPAPPEETATSNQGEVDPNDTETPVRPMANSDRDVTSHPQDSVEEQKPQRATEEDPNENPVDDQPADPIQTDLDQEATSPRIDLRIHPRDIWGGTLPSAALRVFRPNGEPLRWTQSGFPLEASGYYRIELSAPGHHPAVLELWHSGANDTDALSVRLPGATKFGWVLGVDEQDNPNRASAHLAIGLEHLWFAASGPPARRGGSIEFLMDGEQAWHRVHQRLTNAEESIHISTWWWNSEFELTRDQILGDTAERRPNTVMNVLEASPARKRVMVWEPPVISGFNTDRALIEHAETLNNFEFMGVENNLRDGFWWSMPSVDFSDRIQELTDQIGTISEIGSPSASQLEERWVDLTDLPIDMDIPHASYHQKYIVIDDTEAFVGGMNLKSTDWDTSTHDVFEPRRMEFSSSENARLSVFHHDRDSDTIPRKDYMVRVTGPIVQDVGQTFSTLWNAQRTAFRPYSENSSQAAAPSDLEGNPRGIAMQLVHTMPAPYEEYSILESHLNAVQNANDFILIEDQYWRTPLLVDALIERMTQVPHLQLIVVTNPVSEWTDPGCYWTHATHQQLRNRFGDRYHVAQLKSFATSDDFGFDEVAGNFAEIFIHSKLMIVDDVFMTVGSCNTNNRGFLYEYEMNVNVYDRAFVSAVRQRVISNMLGFARTPDDSAEWIQLFEDVTVWNDWVQSWWSSQGYDISLNGAPLPDDNTPIGFAYSLSFGQPADCALEGIGADITNQ